MSSLFLNTYVQTIASTPYEALFVKSPQRLPCVTDLTSMTPHHEMPTNGLESGMQR